MSTAARATLLSEPLPDDMESAVGLTRAEFEHQLRLMAALKMFELGKISSGKAAELAGMSRLDFFAVCGRYQVSVFNYPPEEAVEELRKDLETLASLESA